MARKKQITLILIILSTLLLAGPGVVDIANAEPISSSIPTDFERQSVPSTLSPSDSIDDGPVQESVKWNLGWNSFDGNWFYVDSVNPVSLHSGWLYTNGAWYWLDPSTHAMAIGLHGCNGSAYWFDASGAMATGWVLDGGTWYYATGSGALARGPVSVGGVRLYRLARQGVEIERAARRVTVYALELCGVRDNGDYILKIDCSKGLYVRTLIDDLGRTLGCGAAMSALCRTRAGIFTLEEAHTLDEIEQLQAEGTLAAQFSCADRLFQAFPEYHADNHNAARLKNGQHVPLPAPEGTVRVYSPEGFLGVAEVTRGVMKLEKSFY